jgi:protein HIRA/HIR1
MYSTDVHPDGTRFATAGGDGTVKVWSMSCLFGGKFSREDGMVNCSKKMKAVVASSKFLQSGNYVSSNTEDNNENSSSSEEREGRLSSMMQQGRQLPPANPQVGVNDLSGLVRRKNGCKISAGGCEGGGGVRCQPLSSTVSTVANASYSFTAPKSNEGALSPLSRLTQNAGATAATATATTPFFNNINHDISNNDNAHLFHPSFGHHKTKNHKLLCTIPSHDGSVLSLRFSPSGIYLATAGDDSCVKIFVRSATPSLVKGNLVCVGTDGKGDTKGNSSGDCGPGASDDIEHWNRIAVCRGHRLDVVGLAWAPDDSHLVSCSLDSMHPIIVWRLYDVLHSKNDDEELSLNDGHYGMRAGVGEGSTLRTLSQVSVQYLHPHKILGRNVHTSTVKGVSFDPAGKYLATSGDDPAICIWRAFGEWGLEARIDADSGVFRSKKRKRQSAGDHGSNSAIEDDEDDPGELASLSLFRRISFAPDGSHVCATNATLRGKNIAAMISREGWTASGPRDGKIMFDGIEKADANPPPGAANLVGHKQPVVASRHCPVFFAAPARSRRGGASYSGVESEESDDDGDAQPDYATLVALGDKRGFVTIWSTKSSRPIFKMQCSESRCTVTDISWGVVRCRSAKNVCYDHDGKDSLVLIVSLLDGYIVGLNFEIPTEVGGGSILSNEKTRRIFQFRYGIEDFVGNYCFSHRKKCQPKNRLVDDSGPVLVENALQIAMEMEIEAEKNSAVGLGNVDTLMNKKEGQQSSSHLLPGTLNIEEKEFESPTEGGEKPFHPLTTSLATTSHSDEGNAQAEEGDEKRDNKSMEKPTKSLQNVSNDALVVDDVTSVAINRVGAASGSQAQTAAKLNSCTSSGPASVKYIESHSTMCSLGPVMKIPCTMSKILSAELTTRSNTALSSTVMTSSPMDYIGDKVIADCTNSTSREGTSSWHSVTLTISRGGVKKWMDIIVRTKATAIAANDQLLVVGTSDGRLYLYGTSPTLGWMSCRAYRAFPPFVLGSPVVELHLCGRIKGQTNTSCELVVATSEGNFFVYSMVTSGKPKLKYRGSIIPAMQHMHLQQRSSSPPPQLVRIQVTDSNQLMLILFLPQKSSGGLLWGFIYNLPMELWMCISDTNNYVLSDLYSALPSRMETTQSYESNQQQGDDDNGGILAKMDTIIRSSASAVTTAKQMYHKVTSSESNNGPSSNDIITRSHCEDRLACSIALGSPSEFIIWLRYYSRFLVSTGNGDALRFLTDILLNGQSSLDEKDTTQPGNLPSFLSIGKETLGLNGKDLVRSAVLPECLTSRHLQRLTNEISMELLLD